MNAARKLIKVSQSFSHHATPTRTWEQKIRRLAVGAGRITVQCAAHNSVQHGRNGELTQTRMWTETLGHKPLTKAAW